MDPLAILKPTLALGLWTLLIFFLIPMRRMQAVRAGTLTIDDFKLGESARVPEHVALPNRNAMNLLQLPVLFYAASVILFTTAQADAAFVGLAWAYVVLRVAHSLVHVTYNNVRHRLLPFGISNLVLLAIWLRLTWLIA